MNIPRHQIKVPVLSGQGSVSGAHHATVSLPLPPWLPRPAQREAAPEAKPGLPATPIAAKQDGPSEARTMALAADAGSSRRLTPQERAVLAALAMLKRGTAVEIAAAARVEEQHTRNALSRLRALGFVETARPKGKVAHTHFVTAAGRIVIGAPG
jgi:hypothetical protein